MMIKRARFSSDDEPLVHLIEPGEMVKTASGMVPEVQKFISTLRPDSRYTYTLVNAMGYSEYFGANSNKDYYGYNPHLGFNGLMHAPPDWGADPANDMVRGKKWFYGYPCFYGASVYAHHKNSNPELFGFGDVVFVMPNHRMKRIELVLRVNHERAHAKGRANLLDRIRSGERMDVSMGAKVPFDLCSISTDWEAIQRAWGTFDPVKHAHPGIAILKYHKNVAPIAGLSVTRADYSEYMRKMPGQILPDGRKVFVYNDFPRFFDISFVWIGADRTARVMWHLSPEKGVEQVTREQTEIIPGPVTTVHRRLLMIKGAENEKTAADSMFYKASEIEKEIPAVSARKIELHTLAEPDIPYDLLARACDSSGPKSLLSTLAVLGIALKPREFQVVISRGNPLLEKLAEEAMQEKKDFDTSTSDVGDQFAVTGEGVRSDVATAMQHAQGARSSYAPSLLQRLTNKTPQRSVLLKESSALAKMSAFEQDLAAEYNGYRLSLLENAADIYPQYPLLPFVKTANPLLLGLAPVIHLASAHLRKKQDAGEELGTVGSLIAENPTFFSMSTIGMGLRALMAADARGGIITAAKSLAGVVKKTLVGA